MRPSLDRYFIDMARLVASRSTCVRRSVGCVLINSRNHVMATGYNGGPAGAKHCNDPEVATDLQRLVFPNACAGAATAMSGQNLDQCNAVHAEQNAILQCSDAHSITTAYVTAFPCDSCTKLLLNTSCHRIVYLEPYAGNGARRWIEAGRVAEQFSGEPPMIQRDLVRLFDDELNEWRVVLACVCLNLCSARVARGVIMRVLNRWPKPNILAQAKSDLEAVLKPLGLSERRALYLRNMSAMWGTVSIDQLPGVGPYAVQSVEVFCRGNLEVEKVADRKVAAWLDWKRRNM